MGTDTRIVSAAEAVHEAPSIVSIEGPVDTQAGLQLMLELHRLIGAGARRCVVDLTGATSFGATGLAALLTSRRMADTAGGWLRLVSPPSAVLDYVAEAMRPAPFDVRDTVEEATA